MLIKMLFHNLRKINRLTPRIPNPCTHLINAEQEWKQPFLGALKTKQNRHDLILRPPNRWFKKKKSNPFKIKQDSIFPIRIESTFYRADYKHPVQKVLFCNLDRLQQAYTFILYSICGNFMLLQETLKTISARKWWLRQLSIPKCPLHCIHKEQELSQISLDFQSQSSEESQYPLQNKHWHLRIHQISNKSG